MSNLTAIIQGVQKAIAAAGKPMTIRRTVAVSDPTKPTQPPVLTPVDTPCFGYVAVVRGWDSANRVVTTSTDAYIDPLSITGNTVDTLTFITGQGDILITADGKQYLLNQTLHPEFQGRIALFWHTGIA